jgi:purine-nucleoside phosphorylase
MVDEMVKIKEASEFIKAKIDATPDIAIILGSGLGSLADDVENRIEIKYSEIPHFPVSTVAGHAGQFVYGDLEGKKVIIMQGRFHYYEGYDIKTVTFPVRVLKMIGTDKLIVTNAAGGVNTNFKPGDLMIIKDHINFSGANPLIGRNLDELGPRFPDMSQAYSKELINIAFDAAKEAEVDVVSGVYIMLSGPTYETPAEVRMLRTLGADATGMSTVPEVIVANHCGMKVLGISCITNMACGILDQPLCHDEVIETSNMVKDKFKKLIKGIVRKV